MEILKAASGTDARKLAGAITEIVRSQDAVEVHAIGAGAVNQAVKAIAIARGFLVLSGINIAIFPSFTATDDTYDGDVKTAIRLEVARV